MPITRDSVKPPTLPRETYHCAELGGAVTLRGPKASARIAVQHQARAEASVAKLAPIVLASSVLDAEDEPLFTAEQWDEWGGSKERFDAYVALFNAAMKLWGFDEVDNAKN